MSFFESPCQVIEHDGFFEPQECVENTSYPEIHTDTFTGIEFGLFPHPENEDTKVAISKQPLDTFDLITIGLVGSRTPE